MLAIAPFGLSMYLATPKEQLLKTGTSGSIESPQPPGYFNMETSSDVSSFNRERGCPAQKFLVIYQESF
jgi:hypothetical protein